MAAGPGVYAGLGMRHLLQVGPSRLSSHGLLSGNGIAHGVAYPILEMLVTSPS